MIIPGLVHRHTHGCLNGEFDEHVLMVIPIKIMDCKFGERVLMVIPIMDCKFGEHVLLVIPIMDCKFGEHVLMVIPLMDCKFDEHIHTLTPILVAMSVMYDEFDKHTCTYIHTHTHTHTHIVVRVVDSELSKCTHIPIIYVHPCIVSLANRLTVC